MPGIDCRITNILIYEIMSELKIESTDEKLKRFFDTVLRMAHSTNSFPVNLDDVWWMMFGKKGSAVRYLKTYGKFKEGEDYAFTDGTVLEHKQEKAEVGLDKEYKDSSLQSDAFKDFKLRKDGKIIFSNERRSKRRPSRSCFLSVPCLEYLISTRNRGVFNVYINCIHQSGSCMEGYFLSSIGETFYNLISCSRIEDVFEFLVAMSEKKRQGIKFPVYLNEVFSLGFPSLQAAVDELKRLAGNGYMEGSHYVKGTTGNQPGYHLSLAGFDRLITIRSGLVARAYSIAVSGGQVRECY